jgi:hypothetical protein
MRWITPSLFIGTEEECSNIRFKVLYTTDAAVARSWIDSGESAMVPDEATARRTLMLLRLDDADHFQRLFSPPDPTAQIELPNGDLMTPAEESRPDGWATDWPEQYKTPAWEPWRLSYTWEQVPEHLKFPMRTRMKGLAKFKARMLFRTTVR